MLFDGTAGRADRTGPRGLPDSIGQAVSSGCIRMTNHDVIDLNSRTRVGTRVS